jgi:Tol biopolymer transport system component
MTLRSRTPFLVLSLLVAVSLACNPRAALLDTTPTPHNLPTTAALAPTLAPAAQPTAQTLPPTEPPLDNALPVVLDPCSLLTQAEAEAALGEAVNPGKFESGSCLYADAASGQHVVGVYATQGADAFEAIKGQLFLLGFFGLQIDASLQQQLTDMEAQNNLVGIVETLATASQGNPGFSSQAPAGVSQSAYWAWKEVAPGSIWQGFLIAVNNDVSVIVNMVVGASRDEPASLAAATTIAQQTLARLPAKFTLGEPAVETTSDEPTAPPASGGDLIAFETNRDGKSEIYVINIQDALQTGNAIQKRITNNDAYGNFQPAWSPDGQYLAFMSIRGSNTEEGDIYVINADGTGETQLTSDPANDDSPAWSPDGSRLVFVSSRDGNPELYIMNADGSGQTRLTNDTAQEGHPAWSPDGTQIAFYSTRANDRYQIFVMNVDGSGLKQLVDREGVATRPAWSPDGTKIAFRLRDDTGSNIFVMNADGSNQTNLTNNALLNFSPTWSLDGARIAYVAIIGENAEIFVMNADGSGQTNLTNSPASEIFPAWQP